MNPNVMAWLACAASAALFGWAWTETAREVRFDLGVVSGASFDMPDAPRDAEPLFRELDGGRFEVDMRAFAFDDYDPPELRGDAAVALGAESFPAPLPELDGKNVTVVGYPLVTSLDEGEAEHLILTRFAPGCCFGAIPIVDEWLDVELAGGQDASDSIGVLVQASGRLEVGEKLAEDGTVESLYRLRGATLDRSE